LASLARALDRTLFKALTGRLREPLERVDEFWGIVGRRGGKSRSIAALCVYIAALIDHSAVLVAGERPVVLCLAPSQKQAAVVLGYVAGVFESTPMLRKLIKSKTAEILTLTNGIEIEIRAASFRNTRGVTAIAVIADEAAFFFDDSSGSTNTDAQILDALRPALATTNGPLIVITSPHARKGAVFETFDRHYGPKGDPRILVARGASRDFNPSLPQKVVDRALERDYASASSEYLGLFRSDLEAFVSIEVVKACVLPNVHEIEPRRVWNYIGFVDPSGGSSDAMTLATAYSDGESAHLVAIREVRPPFSPERVVSEFAILLRSYGVTKVFGDRYGGEFVQERFRSHGITYTPAARTRSEIYAELLPILNSKRAVILDNKQLIAQLVGLERRTSPSGRDTIDHPRGSHDDIANASAGAIVYALDRPRNGRFIFDGVATKKWSSPSPIDLFY
jgi:hypothetical protein